MGEVDGTLGDLLADLDSPEPGRRGVATLALREFADSAVATLFRAAARPENRNHSGSLVFALSAFRCEDHFLDFFAMALDGNYEVQCHALSILQGQNFRVTGPQLRAAELALGQLHERENLPAEDVEALRDELWAVLSRHGPSAGDPA